MSSTSQAWYRTRKSFRRSRVPSPALTRLALRWRNYSRGKSPKWRQVLGGLNKDLPPPCRGRGRGMCDLRLDGRARIALGPGTSPKTLPPISVNSIWQFFELNQVRRHDRRRIFGHQRKIAALICISSMTFKELAAGWAISYWPTGAYFRRQLCSDRAFRQSDDAAMAAPLARAARRPVPRRTGRVVAGRRPARRSYAASWVTLWVEAISLRAIAMRCSSSGSLPTAETPRRNTSRALLRAGTWRGREG